MKNSFYAFLAAHGRVRPASVYVLPSINKVCLLYFISARIVSSFDLDNINMLEAKSYANEVSN